MNLVDCWAPTNNGTSVGNAFMLASLSARGGRMEISLDKEGTVKNGARELFAKTDNSELSLRTPKLYAYDHPVMVCIATQSYAFAANVSDEEIELWDRPIEEHSAAIPTLEMVAVTRRGKRHWIAEYELSLSGLRFNVHLIDSDNSPDPRFTDESELPDNIRKTLGLAAKEKVKSISQNHIIPFGRK